MRLTNTALTKINNPQTRMKIGLALGVADQSVSRYIKENSIMLTTLSALEVIRKETGLADEEILEEAKAVA